jgi:hypothetical protein
MPCVPARAAAGVKSSITWAKRPLLTPWQPLHMVHPVVASMSNTLPCLYLEPPLGDPPRIRFHSLLFTAQPLLCPSPSRPRRSSRQAQPCLIRSLTRLLHADEPPRGAAATLLPLIRPPTGLQSLFALHPSPYVTQIAKLPFDPERTPSNCIFAPPAFDHRCSHQKFVRCTVS